MHKILVIHLTYSSRFADVNILITSVLICTDPDFQVISGGCRQSPAEPWGLVELATCVVT